MRTTTKKLVLHRETLAGLDSAELRKAAGGDSFLCPSFTCQPSPCQYSDGQNTCFTCYNGVDTCTSNYC